MYWFKELTKIARKIGVYDFWNTISGDHELKKYDIEKFYEYVKVCQPFVFHVEHQEQKIVYPGGSEDIELDLPFPVVSMELTRQVNGTWSFLGENWLRQNVEGATDQFRDILSLMVIEKSPKEYGFFVYSSKTRAREAYTSGMMPLMAITEYSEDPELKKTVEFYLGKLSSGKAGLENTDKDSVGSYITLGNGKAKTSRKIRNIVHVFPKSYATKKYEPTGREIDYSHRFAVRGHWMRLFKKGTTEIDYSRIGKDRSGDYCIGGFTWRSDFVKGPEEAPLILKTRLVGSNKGEEP